MKDIVTVTKALLGEWEWFNNVRVVLNYHGLELFAWVNGSWMITKDQASVGSGDTSGKKGCLNSAKINCIEAADKYLEKHGHSA